MPSMASALAKKIQARVGHFVFRANLCVDIEEFLHLRVLSRSRACPA